MAFDGLANPTGVVMDPTGNFGVAKFGNDKLNVMFYTKAELDRQQTSAAGTPFYVNKIYVKIHPPGEMLNVVDRPVRDEDKLRWAVQWNQFTLSKTQVPEGTPVDILFPNHPAIAATMKGMGVYTIQQLSSLSGNGVDGLGMGGQEYVNKAKKYLEEAGDTGKWTELQEEMKKKDNRIEYLEKMFIKQAETIKELQGKLASIGPIDRSQQNLGHVDADIQSERINANHPTKEVKKKQLNLSAIDNL